MVTIFPPPYEDELLYSLCARYSRLMGYVDRNAVSKDLFGRPLVSATVYLPTHLNDLSARLAPLGGPSVDEIIDKHTLLPYYTAFHTVERRKEIRSALGGRTNPHFLLGSMTNRVPAPTTLRYCLACAAEERDRHGEAYWHRLHQLPGVLACPNHATVLENSQVELMVQNNRYKVASADECIPRDRISQLLPENRERDLTLDLAKRARDLLIEPPLATTEEGLRRRYLSVLTKRDLATYSGRVRISALRAAFLEHFPAEFLQKIGMSYDESWSLRLLRRSSGTKHPMLHVLLQSFLDLNRRALLTEPVGPFSEGPWPCLNQASTHYGERRIARVEVHYNQAAKGPIGTFACSCGFAYRRVGPDRVPEDAFRVFRMHTYGAVWCRALRRGWHDPELSLKELAQRLGFDAGTIRRQAAVLGLPMDRPGSKGGKAPTLRSSTLSTSQLARRRAKYREAWLQARDRWPDASISLLRKKLTREHSWLYVHDRAWLKKNRPDPLPRSKSNGHVDWVRRDADLAHQMRDAAGRLLQQERPVRLTRRRLAREIGHQNRLSHNLRKLPVCTQAFEELAESPEAFAVRRIHRAKVLLQRPDCERRTRSHFKRIAGLQARLLESPEVRQAFEEAWKVISDSYGGDDL